MQTMHKILEFLYLEIGFEITFLSHSPLAGCILLFLSLFSVLKIYFFFFFFSRMRLCLLTGIFKLVRLYIVAYIVTRK
jgi:hypothetical protein